MFENGFKPGNDLIPKEHMNFFKNLDLFYETDNYIFVHAGLKEKKNDQGAGSGGSSLDPSEIYQVEI